MGRFLIMMGFVDDGGRTLEESEAKAATLIRAGKAQALQVLSAANDPDNPPTLLSVVTLAADGKVTTKRHDGTTREL
jgi:hypothetical protein